MKKVEAYLRPDFAVVVNDKEVHLHNPPLIYNGSSYLPLKEIGGLLGAEVNWHEPSQSIWITAVSGGSGTEGTGVPAPGNESGEAAADPPSQAQPAPAGDSEPSTGRSPSDPIGWKNEIALGSLARYKITYLGREYPVLANSYKSKLYFRLNDLKLTGVNTAGLTYSQDKMNKEWYIDSDLVKIYWKEIPRVELMSAPVIIGETNPDKLELLNSLYHYTFEDGRVINLTIYSIEALPDANEYEYLVGTDTGRYMGYKVKLERDGNGKWVYQSVGSITYADDSDKWNP